jgi:CheY-like chemotaxis protein
VIVKLKKLTMTPFHILLVEDNEGDIILTMEALNEGKAGNKVSIARDGEQAIQFLNKEGAYADATRPDLILLDINLPRIDGNEVLVYIKTNPVLKSIPVIMLSTSTSEKDIAESYKNFANSYISKPADLDKFFEVIQKIQNYWISIVHLPKND